MRIARRGLFAASLAAPATLHAQGWPSQPIRVIVPFAAGTTDTVGRLVTAEMAKSIPATLVAENRPGAGGALGSEACARSAPDGNTICMGTISSHAINPAIMARIPYDVARDFAPITQLAAQPNALAVSNNFPARDIPTLIARLRERPDESYGTSGVGTSIHLAGALFAQMTGTSLTHVPYRGSAGVATALMSGELPMAFDNLSSVLPLAREGKLRVLAVTSTTRAEAAPEIPALAETLPGFESVSWHGLFAPAAVPAPIIARLHQAAVAALATPNVRERFAALGITPVGSSPAEFRAFIAAETTRWGGVARAANIRLD
ncbi:tripartite tricarboxylate transporter substrate binding protein [Rhodovarius crocodyli]|uniref:Tripartite tricarboxylate transporter substrate binding protein n=1 Tax=Rhodovarius crocodyli TaxID=1979269 RepID=A0A437MEA4_9PROT|nr:tripartite tricarboxylate transporter substrate binding protein [Rhodovarius crocodyli]RVT95929.1 tripartite tricarboxylate transporter substrate binding protein [Rhodovarius crocodyli]